MKTKQNETQELEESGLSEITEKAEKKSFNRLTLDEYLFYGLIIFSLIGVAISQSSWGTGHLYWLAMVPLLAVASLYVEWSHAQLGTGVRWKALLKTQLIHWGSLLVAVQLAYMLLDFGTLNKQSIGQVILLLVAQTTFLMGIYVDWRFYVLGAFLAIALIVVSYLEAYIWLLMLIAIGIITLGLYLHRRFEISPHNRSRD
ncbi:hypothetical protein [Nitrosococcus watsonii]|uniref:Uncharacterized protein n=1 Tax=Nitrosococcus watsoni (strain C-113) TaxID=105559 RepID=D8K4E6_NITWC|nr:hypothetical protein [Nitrosococcus watsonii]ADJ27843.1 conserved hypothetical protein [Nitrosococcus watsonii C-113]